MKAKPVILVALIVILPLALLAGAARYIAMHEQAVAQLRLQQLMTQRMDDINGVLVRYFDRVSRELRQLTAIDSFDIENLREVTRREPRFLQLFVLAPDGNLRFPDPLQPLNQAETNFLLLTSRMFTDLDLKTAVSKTESAKGSAKSPPDNFQTGDLQNNATNNLGDSFTGRTKANGFTLLPNDIPSQQTNTANASEGWFVWYWERGQNLIYWQRRPSGDLVGVALERSRWMADLIAELPETVVTSENLALPKNSAFDSGLRLVDAASSTVYQWGRVPVEGPTMKPFCEIPVVFPLTAWRLQCLVPAGYKESATGRGLQFGLWAGLLGTGIGLSALAMLLLRGYARDMREASQQVSFVNHVSHELKTPLTNIRMYAELLDRDLKKMKDTLGERPQQRLNVILSEGERLSRLIANVLTFARQQRKTLQPQPRRSIPNECISHIVDRFRPSLAALTIEIDLNLETGDACRLDPDFLEQILGNLISNVEKYAAIGGRLGIRCSTHDDMLTIVVEDNGPGIPRSQREEIFRPFKRLNNDISYAAGTGIGLTIARELARLHGGDIRILNSLQGCLFEVQLKCPRFPS